MSGKGKATSSGQGGESKPKVSFGSTPKPERTASEDEPGSSKSESLSDPYMKNTLGGRVKLAKRANEEEQDRERREDYEKKKRQNFAAASQEQDDDEDPEPPSAYQQDSGETYGREH